LGSLENVTRGVVGDDTAFASTRNEKVKQLAGIVNKTPVNIRLTASHYVDMQGLNERIQAVDLPVLGADANAIEILKKDANPARPFLI
jgi:hypothetical protein